MIDNHQGETSSTVHLIVNMNPEEMARMADDQTKRLGQPDHDLNLTLCAKFEAFAKRFHSNDIIRLNVDGENVELISTLTNLKKSHPDAKRLTVSGLFENVAVLETALRAKAMGYEVDILGDLSQSSPFTRTDDIRTICGRHGIGYVMGLYR